ncbi:hypothetical protein B0H15DRAFT_797412 [Mycena belliarum]|uniref:Uncharacterized protein n=1 Tax=Mycena belliarum TaxID=1033014 RepID=A0AAD6UDE9_9AGAR|nr:hypothetical protein B0H15DRAFT_797412 [Mycena belliae]
MYDRVLTSGPKEERVPRSLHSEDYDAASTAVQHVQSLNYAALGSMPNAHVWRPHKTGWVLREKREGPDLPHLPEEQFAHVAVVGVVSDNQPRIGPAGDFVVDKGKDLWKAKYRMVIERPDNAVFACGWTATEENLTHVESMITEKPTTWFWEKGRTKDAARGIRLGFSMWTAKSEGKGSDVDLCDWPIEKGAEELYATTAKTWDLKILPLWDIDDTLVRPTDVMKVLPGCLVEAHFGLTYSDFKTSWPLIGEIKELKILQRRRQAPPELYVARPIWSRGGNVVLRNRGNTSSEPSPFCQAAQSQQGPTAGINRRLADERTPVLDSRAHEQLPSYHQRPNGAHEVPSYVPASAAAVAPATTQWGATHAIVPTLARTTNGPNRIQGSDHLPGRPPSGYDTHPLTPQTSRAPTPSSFYPTPPSDEYVHRDETGAAFGHRAAEHRYRPRSEIRTDPGGEQQAQYPGQPRRGEWGFPPIGSPTSGRHQYSNAGRDPGQHPGLRNRDGDWATPPPPSRPPASHGPEVLNDGLRHSNGGRDPGQHPGLRNRDGEWSTPPPPSRTPASHGHEVLNDGLRQHNERFDMRHSPYPPDNRSAGHTDALPYRARQSYPEDRDSRAQSHAVPNSYVEQRHGGGYQEPSYRGSTGDGEQRGQPPIHPQRNGNIESRGGGNEVTVRPPTPRAAPPRTPPRFSSLPNVRHASPSPRRAAWQTNALAFGTAALLEEQQRAPDRFRADGGAQTPIYPLRNTYGEAGSGGIERDVTGRAPTPRERQRSTVENNRAPNTPSRFSPLSNGRETDAANAFASNPMRRPAWPMNNAQPLALGSAALLDEQHRSDDRVRAGGGGNTSWMSAGPQGFSFASATSNAAPSQAGVGDSGSEGSTMVERLDGDGPLRSDGGPGGTEGLTASEREMNLAATAHSWIGEGPRTLSFPEGDIMGNGTGIDNSRTDGEIQISDPSIGVPSTAPGLESPFHRAASAMGFGGRATPYDNLCNDRGFDAYAPGAAWTGDSNPNTEPLFLDPAIEGEAFRTEQQEDSDRREPLPEDDLRRRKTRKLNPVVDSSGRSLQPTSAAGRRGSEQLARYNFKRPLPEIQIFPPASRVLLNSPRYEGAVKVQELLQRPFYSAPPPINHPMSQPLDPATASTTSEASPPPYTLFDSRYDVNNTAVVANDDDARTVDDVGERLALACYNCDEAHYAHQGAGAIEGGDIFDPVRSVRDDLGVDEVAEGTTATTALKRVKRALRSVKRTLRRFFRK